MSIEKPRWLFGRAREWEQLSSFASAPASAGAGLAIIYGRRRQGKTALLESIGEATGGR